MSKAIIAGIFGIFFVAAGVYAFVVYWTNPRPDPHVVACVNALPNAKSIGIDFSIKNQKDVSATFGQSITPGTRNAEDAVAILDAMSRCITAARGSLRITNGVLIPSEQPIGAIAHLWDEEKNGATATFSPSNDTDRRVLNNLRLTPTAGPKAAILRQWCTDNNACVICKEANIGSDLINFDISLKPDANPKEVPASKQPWPIPGPDTKLKDWELVDSHGRRTLYVCAAK